MCQLITIEMTFFGDLFDLIIGETCLFGGAEDPQGGRDKGALC